MATSQSAQRILHDLCEAVASAESLRRRGEPFESPHRETTYRQVLFSNQAPEVRAGRMVLPCGKAGDLEVFLPEGVNRPGRWIEVRLGSGAVEIVCEVILEPQPPGPTIGIDLGVNTIRAATDGDKAVLVSGREIKATVPLGSPFQGFTRLLPTGEPGGSRRQEVWWRTSSRTLAASPPAPDASRDRAVSKNERGTHAASAAVEEARAPRC
jgi:hypothetical protein